MGLLSNLIWKFGGIGVLVILLHQGTKALGDVGGGMFDMVKIVASEADMNGFHKVLQSIYIRDEKYPKTGEDLFAWFKEHYDKPIEIIAKDPWGSGYWFLNPGWEIMCAGPDQKYRSRDDMIQSYPSNARPSQVDGWIVP